MRLLELKTEIRFIPNDKQLVKPEVKAAVNVKRVDKKAPDKRKKKRAPRKKAAKK